MSTRHSPTKHEHNSMFGRHLRDREVLRDVISSKFVCLFTARKVRKVGVIVSFSHFSTIAGAIFDKN